MMNEEDLKRRFCALFDPLHTSVSAGAVLARAHALPRRKKLRPLRVLAACVCLLLGAGTIYHLLTTKLVHEVRGPSMGFVMKGNLFINGAYIFAVIMSLL